MHAIGVLLTRLQQLPVEVQSELMLHAALCPFLEADLSRPWLKRVVATDASPAYGFGVSVANCSQPYVA